MRTEDGAISRGVWAPPEAGKGREHVLPWSLRRNRPCRRLASGRRDPFRSPEERCGTFAVSADTAKPGGSLQRRGRARLPRSPGSGAPGEGTPCAAWLRGVWTRGFCSRQRSGGASAFAAAGSHRHHGPAPLQMVRSTPESPGGPLGPLPARWECTPQVGVLWTEDMMRDPWASPLPSVGMGGAC